MDVTDYAELAAKYAAQANTATQQDATHVKRPDAVNRVTPIADDVCPLCFRQLLATQYGPSRMRWTRYECAEGHFERRVMGR